MLRENFAMSWDNIIHNKMRSFLTSLGIVIGVAAVIALITIVQSVTGEMMSQFESLGADKITVVASGTPLKQGLSLSDIEKIEKVDNVYGVAPTVSLTGSAGRQGVLVEDISIQGKSGLFFTTDEVEIAQGRPLTESDMGGHNYVCVIDETLSANVFKGENPIGQKLMLNGQGYEVVGVSADAGDDMMGMMAGGSNSDEGSATIPYEMAMSLSGAGSIMNIEVYLIDSSLSEQTITEVEDTLDAIFNYKDDSYSVINLESIVEMMSTMQSMLTSLLAGIASIALVVGGIGIMNMMLVSVTERTKEIGLRKALGAEPARIQVQFIMEAIALSLIGGIAGILLGIGIALAATVMLETTFVFSWGAVALGAGFSFGVGLIFGWTPAKKASALKPIDALRTE